MADTAHIEVKDRDLLAAIRVFLRSILELPDVDAMLAPIRLPMKNTVMPMLVTDPDRLAEADPLAPVFALNAAKLVGRLTRRPHGHRLVVLLRPCEQRAFVELVKLNQGSVDEIITIGIDCLSAFQNVDYNHFVSLNGDESTRRYVEAVLEGKPAGVESRQPAPACRVCVHPVSDGVDIQIGLYGVSTENGLPVFARTPLGREIVDALKMPAKEKPSGRDAAVEALIAQRTAERDRMFAATDEAVGSLEKLTAYLAGCVNCYNCRVACPVCYCRECVFNTDVFDHEPLQYLKWATRKGAVKMPTDTVFFHLTRLAHMSHACVGCGQCSNACPNDIPVMELFRTVAARTQQAFDYEPGRSLDEAPPLSEFKVDEYPEITARRA